MTNTEYHTQLRDITRNSENRYIDSKKQLENLFKTSKDYDPSDLEWLKEFWRDAKNASESDLKHNQKELTHYNQGMNAPFFYPY